MDNKYMLENFRREVMEKIYKRERLNKIFWTTINIISLSSVIILFIIFIYIAICNYLYL